MEKVKSSVKQNYDQARLITRNVAEFVDAVCLTIVSGFAIYTYVHTVHRTLWDFALGFAGVAIALQAFVLLVKHFNKQ